MVWLWTILFKGHLVALIMEVQIVKINIKDVALIYLKNHCPICQLDNLKKIIQLTSNAIQV
jgi:hypothetical protein